MSAEFTCDGCGKREPARFYPTGEWRWFKPPSWYQRADEDGIQDACSRECIEKIAEATGKGKIVMPW